jgi:nucleoporin SEH1
MAIDAASMMRGGGPTTNDQQQEQQQHLLAENQALYQTNRSGGSSSGGTHSQVLASHHADYILAMALDIYGRRMATVSGDRTVRIWELQADGVWSVAAAWQAHRSAVTAVTWAHPEFGSLLATAGADHDVKIWEEMSHTTNAAAALTASSFAGSGGGNPVATATTARWNLTASLTDARRGMTCVEFAPRQWGLKVATGSSDGSVRIYEAVDIMNLSQWPIAATMAAFDETVGTTTASATSADHHSNTMASTAATSLVGSGGCTCLSWCTGRFDPPTLAVGGSHCVLLYRYSESVRAWQSIWSTSLAASDVLDVAWAPNVGRRFHALALVTTDSTVRFLEFSRYSTPPSSSSTANNSNTNDAGSETPFAVLSQQDVTVPAWRCQWNVTGTVLAVAGDAGMIQLFKRDGDGRYFSAAKIQGDLSQFATMNAIP